MKRTIVGTCVVLAFAAAAGAQDQKMATEKMDHMAMEKAYSGCVETSQTGSYTLTHSKIADPQKSMKKADSMTTGGSGMETDVMKDDHGMAHDGMAPASLALSAGSGINLNKYVGHKVTVTGTEGDSMNGMATFKVKSLKMLGGSCMAQASDLLAEPPTIERVDILAAKLPH